jgi:hypothetical protein
VALATGVRVGSNLAVGTPDRVGSIVAGKFANTAVGGADGAGVDVGGVGEVPDGDAGGGWLLAVNPGEQEERISTSAPADRHILSA